MKIIIHISDDEAYRGIEDEDENIIPAYRHLNRIIENECTIHQIRYNEIEIIFSED